MTKAPRSPDWTFCIAWLVVMSSLILFAKINAFRFASVVKEADLEVEDVLVRVEGAVKKTGSFRVVPGTRLGEVIKKARPLPMADLQKLPLDHRIDEPMEIVVEELKEVVVKVCGEAEEAEFRLPVGSRLCDLQSKVSLKKGADASLFKRKRRLKNQEVIEVPKERY